MCRIIGLSSLSNWLRLTALCTFILSANGCAVMKSVQEESWFSPRHVEKDIERSEFSLARGDDVIGRLAVVRLEKGDTLPDIARHFGLGVNAISAVNPEVDVWVPEAGKRIVLPLNFILPDSPRNGIVVNLATMRLFEFKGESNSRVVTYPVGVGTSEKPTPTGQMHVAHKATRPTWHVPASIAEAHRKKGDPLPATIPPGPENPLGEFALYLSKSGYLIHGTNKPASIGQRNGVLYMEAHTPLEDSGAVELGKIYAKLKNIEKKSARALDWKKVKEVQADARGIPVPIFEMIQGSQKQAAKTIEVEHPDKLYGRPQIPELRSEAWYVLAADVPDEIEALRIATIINHQGPQIPARVLSKRNSHRVIAGPFNDAREAKEAARRLKIDLDIDGVLIEPARKI